MKITLPALTCKEFEPNENYVPLYNIFSKLIKAIEQTK
jgi:hypothetical protein